MNNINLYDLIKELETPESKQHFYYVLDFWGSLRRLIFNVSNSKIPYDTYEQETKKLTCEALRKGLTPDQIRSVTAMVLLEPSNYQISGYSSTLMDLLTTFKMPVTQVLDITGLTLRSLIINLNLFYCSYIEAYNKFKNED